VQFHPGYQKAQQRQSCPRYHRAQSEIQLLAEALLEDEAVGDLITLSKNSMPEDERAHAKVKEPLTLIAGSPAFCCKKVGICTGNFCEIPIL